MLFNVDFGKLITPEIIKYLDADSRKSTNLESKVAKIQAGYNCI